MATWTNYWRIITPTTRNAAYQQPASTSLDDAMNLNTSGYASFSTIAWFSNLMKGATSRLQRYKQYDAMDKGDISRALDIIAEEVAAPDKRTGLPFIIDYQTEEHQEIPETTATTIRAALRHWGRHHNLNKKVFNVARGLVKYGDVFFKKTSDTKKWQYVDATRVVAIEIDVDQNVLNYHVRPSSFQAVVPSKNKKLEDAIEIIPAAAMVHFSLSDDMGDAAPFGMSILQAAFSDYQKLTMLEDSAIIYRIVRAPERRVFYVDVGNMAPQKVKAYLEQIKNDIRQKRMPNTANQNQTDSTYNPESIQEDYFFPVTGTGRGSRVETIPGGSNWEIPELEYFMNKVFRALRVPMSYMRGQEATGGAQYNDGKVGVAYMEERIFANFVLRLQAVIEEVFDLEFKTYLLATGINIDTEIFKLVLPEPQNFALYRQAALDSDLISSFKSIEETGYLSKRFMLERYLGLTKDDIARNEALLKQERGIAEDAEMNVEDIQMIYDPAVYENRDKVEVVPKEEADAAAEKSDKKAAKNDEADAGSEE